MKIKLTLVAAIFFFVLVPIVSQAADRTDSADSLVKTIDPSSNKILKITETGLSPATLELSRAGNSVFFYNDTKDSILGIEIDYGQKLGFCATGKMMMHEDGVFRSKTPFSPKGFVVSCFSQQGSYPVTVYGAKGNPKGIKGTIVVK